MGEWPEGYARCVFDSLDSTLSEAARMIPTLQGPTWILALEQTRARGRRGRAWSTPRGNFAATLVMERPEVPGVAALRSFVASLALWHTFVDLTGQEADFTLKWPNDVLLRECKVAGILLESIGDHLAIGIGVNLAHAPRADAVEPGAVQPVALREIYGIDVSPEIFLEVLARHYAVLDGQFRMQGFEPIRQGWLARAARRGAVITARTMRDETTGVFEDVDAQGSLILNVQGKRVAITAADVYF